VQRDESLHFGFDLDVRYMRSPDPDFQISPLLSTETWNGGYPMANARMRIFSQLQFARPVPSSPFPCPGASPGDMAFKSLVQCPGASSCPQKTRFEN
jgi:hypothetical protein